MPQFRYLAKNMEGKNLRGTMDAAGESALQQQLKEQGLFLVQAKDVTASKSARKFSSKLLSEFCKELSTLLASGISIVRALEIVADEEGLPAYARSVYLSVLADLRKGTSLSEAMESKKCFPELMLGMIRSGEGSGNIDAVMERLSLHYERENRLKNQVKSAMAYPAVLLVMCVAVVILIVTFILPQFDELFSQMESLPAVTEWLMAASDFLVHQWYLALLAIFLLAVVVRIILKIYKIRRTIDCLKIRMPVIGRLNKIIYTARFARTLSSLYSSDCGGITDGGQDHRKCIRGGAVRAGGGHGAKRHSALPGAQGSRRSCAETRQYHIDWRGERAAGYDAGFHRNDYGGGSRGSHEAYDDPA